MTAHLQHNGQPLKIVGYACLFDTTIENRGQALTFARDAFLPTLRHNASGVRALVDHKWASEWACTQDGSLRLWQDHAGLAFAAMIPNTIEGRGLARAVGDGLVAASVHFRPFRTEETADGYIVQAAILTEISLTTRPAYPTATWLSELGLMRHMSDYALDLRRRWRLGSMKNRTARKPLSINARAMTYSCAGAVAERRAPIPVAVYNPAPKGLSQEEWEEFGFQEDAGRRAWKQARARTQARRAA